MTAIPERFCLGCESLTTITLPDSVTTIGGGAFSECSSLESINIPSSLVEIRSRAFETSGLTALTIPDAPAGSKGYLCSIGESAFKDSSLVSVYLGSRVGLIEINAFYQCSALQSVSVYEHIRFKGASIFFQCTSLVSVTFLSGQAPTVPFPGQNGDFFFKVVQH